MKNKNLLKKTFIIIFLFCFPCISLHSEDLSKAEDLSKVNKQSHQIVTKEKLNEIAQSSSKTSSLNLKQIISASPFIYSFLIVMSITSLVIWLYAFITFRIKNMSAVNTVKDLRLILVKKNWEEAMDYCHKNKSLLSKMINSAINSRKHGHEFMIDSMKSEGKRLTTSHWQKVSILNDIVVIAPMLGLLGTVLGMFYAFYDINRSVESITALFDGLGIAVGTTVAGLIVSIVSMTFSTTLKYRLMKIFNHLESEALDLSSLIIVEKKVKKKD